MKTVKFAILGCGKIGIRHAQKMHGVKYARLVAVCDTIADRSRKLGLEYNVKAYTIFMIL